MVPDRAPRRSARRGTNVIECVLVLGLVGLAALVGFRGWGG